MMGAHVSDVPNHQVGRTTSLTTRGWIAMSGNLGYELDISKQSPTDLALIKQQTQIYKKYRKLLQFGEFYRLQAPSKHFASAWLFKNEKEALLLYFNGLAQPAVPLQYLTLHYLDDESLYQNSESGKCFTGSELNYAGVLIPRLKGDFETLTYHWKKL